MRGGASGAISAIAEKRRLAIAARDCELQGNIRGPNRRCRARKLHGMRENGSTALAGTGSLGRVRNYETDISNEIAPQRVESSKGTGQVVGTKFRRAHSTATSHS